MDQVQVKTRNSNRPEKSSVEMNGLMFYIDMKFKIPPADGKDTELTVEVAGRIFLVGAGSGHIGFSTNATTMTMGVRVASLR